MSEPLQEIIETIGAGAEQTTIRYRVFRNHVEFFAAEVIGSELDDTPLYATKEAVSLPMNSTTDFNAAERYVEGSVKWDGCAHYYFGDEQTYIHVCGAGSARQLAETITTVHRRCGELLRVSGQETLKGELEIS